MSHIFLPNEVTFVKAHTIVQSVRKKLTFIYYSIALMRSEWLWKRSLSVGKTIKSVKSKVYALQSSSAGKIGDYNPKSIMSVGRSNEKWLAF